MEAPFTHTVFWSTTITRGATPTLDADEGTRFDSVPTSVAVTPHSFSVQRITWLPELSGANTQ